MIEIQRTDSHNKDFINLVKLLDADLAIRDGIEHGFYAQFNQVDQIKYVVLAFINNQPAGCGSIKHYEDDTIEIKRMYTIPAHRGKGVASQILHELEIWAKEMEYRTCILETGKKQPEAIALYKKISFNIMANYGQYEGVENSMCFEKQLR
ncbi:MAG: GNAT family N-acetyltransferase [Flavobacterium sp.]|nr:GNAT family N-acetyltransferase [Pedobacter sp.]